MGKNDFMYECYCEYCILCMYTLKVFPVNLNLNLFIPKAYDKFS